jgi:hypothetical protein
MITSKRSRQVDAKVLRAIIKIRGMDEVFYMLSTIPRRARQRLFVFIYAVIGLVCLTNFIGWLDDPPNYSNYPQVAVYAMDGVSCLTDQGPKQIAIDRQIIAQVDANEAQGN